MGILALTPDTRAGIQRVRDHAEQPRNWYLQTPTSEPPGHDPRFVVHLGTYRAVFTWTIDPEAPEEVARHLSVSTGRPGKYPDTIAVFTIATLFGFTGGERHAESETTLTAGDDWMLGGVMEDGHAIAIVAQMLSPEEKSQRASRTAADG